VSNYALDIKFKGFKDSLKIYIVQYLQKLFSFVPNDKQYFDTLIEKHRRRYANYFLSDPYRLVYEKNAAAIRTNSSTSEEDKLIEIDNVVLEDVVALNRSWKKRVFLDSYIAGNITK
jgi:secreted Zn-dependent insulinase-like peptidase